MCRRARHWCGWYLFLRVSRWWWWRDSGVTRVFGGGWQAVVFQTRRPAGFDEDTALCLALLHENLVEAARGPKTENECLMHLYASCSTQANRTFVPNIDG